MEARGEKHIFKSKLKNMRYKALAIQKLDNIDGTISRIEISASRNDINIFYEAIERLKEQLGEIRSMVNIEPDDFEQQYKPS